MHETFTLNVSDTALHQQWCSQRDADAFAELMLRHSSMVFSVCVRVLGNENTAEEVAQECFIELMKAWKPISPSVAGWLHTVATRRSVDRLRAEVSRNERENRYAAQTPQASEPTWDDVSGYIDLAIAELSDDVRVPVVLRFLEGRSHKDVAAELDISLSTVKRRVNEGIAAVREHLADKGIVTGAAVLLALLEAAPTFALPTALAAELGKLTLTGSWAVTTGTSGAVALKSAATIGGIIAMKKVAVVAIVVVLAGLAFIQLKPTDEEPNVQVGREEIAPPLEAPDLEVSEEPVAEPEPEELIEALAQAEDEPNVSGRVLDPNDMPIEGATVILRRIAGEHADPRIETLSDADGRFAFADIAPAKRVDITGRMEGMVWMSTPEAMHVLTEEGLTDLVIRLHPAASISGRVVDRLGRPAVAKEVTDFVHVPNEYSERKSAKTDDVGRFNITGLLPGTHSLSVIPEEQFRRGLEDAEIELEAGEQRTGVEIVFAGYELNVAGRVVNESGEPIRGVFVQLIGVDGPNPADVDTDKDGKFRLVRIPEGEYSMMVQHQAYDGQWIAATAGTEDMEIVLKRSEKLTLSGRVVAAETGEPLRKFDVQVRNGVFRKLQDSGFGSFETIESENGRFSKADVARKNVTIIARAPGREMRYEHVDLTQGIQQEIVVRLNPSGSANGIVTSGSGAAVTGAYLLLSPFPHTTFDRVSGNTRLMKDWFERNAVARSADDGSFSIDSLIPELKVITAYHPNHGFGSVAVDRNSATSRTLHITVNQGGIIEGVVTVGGDPVQHTNLRITTRGAFDENLGLTTTDELGAFRMSNVPDGRWSVSARLPPAVSTVRSFSNGRRMVMQADVISERTTTLDFEFPAPSVSLEGMVLIDEEVASSGTVILESNGPSGQESNQVDINANGSYRFDDLIPGEAILTVQASLEPFVTRSASRNLSLEEDQIYEVDVHISGGSTVQGSLLGLDPRATHTRITAFEGEADSAGGDPWLGQKLIRGQTTAHEDGTYILEGLSPGTYLLIVSAAVLDSGGAAIRSQRAEVQFELGGTDGDVIRQDIQLSR